MTFPAPESEPPIVLLCESTIDIPNGWFGRREFPSSVVPMKLPCTRLLLASLVDVDTIKMPAWLLPEIKLRDFGEVPPMRLLLAFLILMPSSPLPAAVVPVASVPMKQD